MKLFYVNIILYHLLLITLTNAGDDDYNIVHKDGSFEFGYTNPDSYHYADGTRTNIVRGEFGGRNPKTGGIDTTVYTAGPRGFRPRGKNVFRNYDLNQNGPRPLGSRDDPYFDPYEDPSYNFAFNTRTYSRKENANRVGDVSGKYSYLDDVGERHNVEFVAGKNTGYHVKTPFPDSNPRSYGPLYFRGRGRPIPRGRTSIQRGLDGSYKFVSAGPDQRRTEVSDSTGHVRGSYTYLDDKGVQHSVHYIAGPETGYRVLKTVKGAHLPTVFPFDNPEIVPPDFYGYGPEGDVFDTAASGTPFKPRGKPSKPSSSNVGNGIDVGKDDYDNFSANKKDESENNGGYETKKPAASAEDEDEDFGQDLFGGNGGSSTTSRPSFKPTTLRPSSRPTGRPSITTFKPTSKPPLPSTNDEDNDEDDGSYRPTGDDGSYTLKGDGYGSSTTSRPGSTTFAGYPSGGPSTGFSSDDDYNLNIVSDKFGAGSRPEGGSRRPCPKCVGTIVTNVGYKPFKVPPGASVRAHVQNIDLYSYEDTSPSEAFRADTSLKREQLNEASTEKSKNKEKSKSEDSENGYLAESTTNK